MFASAPAFAVRGHILERSFGSEGSGNGEFKEPAGVAVDQASHDVYVVDAGNNRVEFFTAEGTYVGEFNGSGLGLNEVSPAPTGRFLNPESIAVDNQPSSPSFGDVYVADVGHRVIDKFSASGAYIGQLAGTCEGANEIPSEACPGSASKAVVPFAGILGVATDVSGQLWVYQQSGEIDSFSTVEINEFLASRTNPESFSANPGLAVDSSDALYVKSEFGEIYKLDSFGNVLSKLFFKQPAQPGRMAVDLSSDEVYVDEADSERSVQRLSASGLAIERFAGGQLSSGNGLAVDSETSQVFVVDSAADKVAVFGLEPQAPPTISSTSASLVSSTSARLEATLNPRGLATTYHFEYGQSAAYGQTAPIPGAGAGSAFGDSAFTITIEGAVENGAPIGLEPDTTYHYRVVASNELGTVQGPDHTFTTQGAAAMGLPDGRGWELVSPPNKHGVAVEGTPLEGSDVQAAADGFGMTYIGKAPISDETEGSRSSVNTQLLSMRTDSGWNTVDITTPHEEVVGVISGKLSEYQVFSDDLSVAALEPSGKTPLAPALMGTDGERTPYRREATGGYTPLVTASNTPEGVKFAGEESQPGAFQNGVTFAGMAPDGNHIVLSSFQPVTEGFATNLLPSLYEWSAGDHQLQLVSILPNGKATGEENLRTGLGLNGVQVRGAISDNGSRVVFEARQTERHLYVRDMARGETLQLDAPASGVEPTLGAAPVFQLASPDGARVFFTDAAHLYMCELAVVAKHLSCNLKDLTVDPGGSEAAYVLGDVIGASENGRHVYFVANGALAPGAVKGDCVNALQEFAASALCNLYVRDTQSEKTSLIAVLSNRDVADWRAGSTGESLQEMTARVSPNGEFVAFMSTRSLTGYDNRDVNSGEPDAEVYLYDTAHSALTCVSCDPSGGRPAGVFDTETYPGLLIDRPAVWRGKWLAASIPGWTPVNKSGALYESRYLSDSGRLFFNSVVGLVPSDTNGRADVYEYEPNGVGGCGLSSGCVALLSKGSSAEESTFLDANVSGDDVFFLTAAQLAPADVDNALDVYDAHVCSQSVPCPPGTASTSPACSTADSCRVAPPAQPDSFGASASATFRGSGNPPVAVKPSVKRLTRAQLLVKALKTCKKKPRRQRSVCRGKAKGRYGPRRRLAQHATKHQGGSR